MFGLLVSGVTARHSLLCCFGSKAECQVVGVRGRGSSPHSNQDSKSKQKGLGTKMSIGEHPQGPAPLSKVLPPKVTFFLAAPCQILTPPMDPPMGGIRALPVQAPTSPSVDTAALGAKPSKHNYDVLTISNHSGGAQGGTGVLRTAAGI